MVYREYIYRGVGSLADLRKCIRTNAFVTPEALAGLEVLPDIFLSDREVRAYMGLHEEPHLIAARFRYCKPKGENARVLADLRNAKVRRIGFLNEVAPWNRKSQTMTCKTCSTVLNVEDLKRYCDGDGSNLVGHVCPHCSGWLLSPSNMVKLHTLDDRITKLEEQLAVLDVTVPTDELAWFVSYGYYA